MKILFVTTFYPYPLNIGGKVVLYNLLKHLGGYHDITLVSLFVPRQDAYSPTLQNYCKEVITIEKKVSDTRKDFLKAISPFSMSYVIKSRYEPAMYKKISKLINLEKFDAIVYEFTQSALYLQNNISIPQILVEDDISFLKAKRQFEIIPWTQPILKYITYMEYLKIHRLETKAWRKVDAIITLTEEDKKRIKQINSRINISTRTYGINFDYYKPNRKEENLKDQILFLGAAENTLNIDGVRFFLEKIWPLILSKKPTAIFKIIGTGFGNIFDKTKLKNVEEVGFVEDIRPYFDSSKVFVVPLLNGSGLRIKILEAMATGCPIVTTSVGCEGINLADGKGAFIKNEPDTFADAVLELLDDIYLRCKFSKNARAKVMRDYIWDSIVGKFNQFLETLKDKKVKCICGSNNYKKIFQGYFNRAGLKDYYFEIMECKNCGVARTYPVPDTFKIKIDTDLAFSDNIKQEEKNNFWAAAIVKLAKKYINSGNLLDVGCFAGKLLEEAEKEGFKAYGVELYEKAVEYGRKKGRNIFLGEVYDAHFNDSFFDCVILNHVFEHIPEPVKFIKEINRILKYSGILIINVPAYKSLMRFIMGENWLSWGPHIHCFFYTKKTLNNIVIKNSQLKPIFIHQKGRLEPPTKGWLRNKLKDCIANFASLINMGEQIEAVYIKK